MCYKLLVMWDRTRIGREGISKGAEEKMRRTCEVKRQREHLMQAARGGTRALGMFVLILQLVGSDHLWNVLCPPNFKPWGPGRDPSLCQPEGNRVLQFKVAVCCCPTALHCPPTVHIVAFASPAWASDTYSWREASDQHCAEPCMLPHAASAPCHFAGRAARVTLVATKTAQQKGLSGFVCLCVLLQSFPSCCICQA
jgi:hypothetical protein